MTAIDDHKIAPIDVVVVNLYPFRQTVTAQQAPSYETAVENIDIGELQAPSSIFLACSFQCCIVDRLRNLAWHI